MTYKIEDIKQHWNEGLITLFEAKTRSKAAGYNMVKMNDKWVWFKK